jgi:hypothetical protein
MTQTIRISNEAANDVVTTWEADFLGDPTEDMECADFIRHLPVDGKFGQTIKVRIVPAMSTTTAATSSELMRSSLTTNINTDRVVTGTNKFVYSVVAVNQSTWNAIRDDSQAQKQYKQMLRYSMEEKIEADVLANAFNLSNQLPQADIDDALLRTGVGRLRKTAKRKAKLGQADIRLYVHPDEVANAMGINAIKEFQIRGGENMAATGKPVNTYGIKWDANAQVYNPSGTLAYCPLILEDAWFIAFNQTAAAIADQTDGFTDWFLFRADYATTELFDSSGVVFALTV